MGKGLNIGDVIKHTGTVTSSASDMTISVIVPALSDSEFDDILPECVTPLRWRPRENDKVTIYQRLGALRPDVGLTWAGWASDSGDTHLAPPWLDAGLVALLGESGRVQVILNDDDSPTADGPLGIGLLGSRLADEPLVLGDAYKAHLETTLDLMAELVDAIDGELSAMNTLNGAHNVWVAAVAAHPLLAAVLAGPGATMQAALLTHISEVASARGKIKSLTTSVRARLVGPTIPVGEDQKTTIGVHLSDYMFTSKSPDPDPFTNEDE